MKSKETLKMASLVVAGLLMVLLSIGKPATKRETLRSRKQALLGAQAEAVLKNCVPGTQVNLPAIPDKVSFLCFLDIKTGFLDNLGPVNLIKPFPADTDQVSINSK